MDTNRVAQMKDWLKGRSISDAVLDEFKVGYTHDEIIIPVFDMNGKKIFNKYRRSPFREEGPKYRYDKGASSALYGAHALHGTRMVIICEGELDALALRSHGFIAVSSTGGAGTFDPRWADMLKKYAKVIICYDRDEAGYKGALNVQGMVPWAHVAMLPNRGNVKDVTDYIAYLSREGKDVPGALDRLFSEARPFAMNMPLGEPKEQMRTLEQRVSFAFTMRQERTNMGLDPSLIDVYIRHNQSLVSDIKKSLKKKKTKIEGESVEAARAVPITNYLKFDRQGFTKCLWHAEKTASLHYILKSNKVYCFGSCQKAFDVIDVVMAQEGIPFAEALERIRKGL